ncbi:threonine-phosphate decarboxylase [Oricola thermophila]|uniref:threonine-phosphate decarboxylase n=1 Tax=Oricola thermophila TaxID=2742145 RepID=A0A6N1VJB2_9HYPH|nr:threonine-phosphate decarboxylase [Oricola thermophila]
MRHGGALDRAIARHGGKREDWLDLSTGINPVAWPVPELTADAWQRLPDEALESECIEAARAYYRVPDEAGIVAAPGTQAIIQWLPVLLNYLDRATIVSPTYGEYEQVLRAAGVGVETPIDLPDAGNINPLLVIGQPNNPDGRVWPERQVAELAGGRGGVRMVVVDEAFADVAPEHSIVPQTGGPGLTVLRSFGKFFGLAGVRLGFAIGDRDVVDALRRMIGPWAVSGPALAIGAQAMRDSEWIAATRERLARDSARLAEMLERTGMRIAGRTDLFVLVEMDEAAEVAEELAKRRILVRSFDSNARWLRFGIPGNEQEFTMLDSVLAAIAGAVHSPDQCILGATSRSC